MRTLTLELLRHGPPHNQLLSPLTQYLALCGNHAPTTVRIPFEHKQALTRLRALGYKESDETRRLQVEDTARVMGEVLAQVPGLIAGLAEAHDDRDSCANLRLILSASELALLPFELAIAPNGFPGAGQAMALQAQLPLCITREVRRVSNEDFEWPAEPKILFLSNGDVPFQQHMDVLREVIDPWVGYFDDQTHQRKIEEHFVVVPEATVDQIQEASAKHHFTHVHILAHGDKLPNQEEERYGIVLRNSQDPSKPDVVDGVRLGALLRTAGPGGKPRSPAVVTLASCEGGAQGDVVGAGSSIAHALHENGVPLVIGSQFPLSKAASVLLLEVLYKELLWGGDPRPLLWDLRGQLKSRIPTTHDWASLVAYAAFPSNLESQLDRVKLRQARRCINAAMDHADQAINRMSSRIQSQKGRTSPPGLPSPPGDGLQHLEDSRQKIQVAKLRLKDIRSRSRTDKATLLGLQASTEKREAEMKFRATRDLEKLKAFRQDLHVLYLTGIDECLRRARDYYWKAFEADPSCSWALVQFLVLDALTRADRRVRADHWITARTLAELDLYYMDPRQAAWAHGSLIELHLLATMPANNGPGIPDPVRAAQVAREHARALSRSPEEFEIYTTSRQILRYIEWFELGLQGIAEEIYSLLTEGGALPPPP